MPLREFADGGGRRWSVWEVNPDNAEPLLSVARSSARSAAPRLSWLAFECEAPRERRRLVPFPTDWAELLDPDLVRLCGLAAEVPVRPRLIE